MASALEGEKQHLELLPDFSPDSFTKMELKIKRKGKDFSLKIKTKVEPASP